ncbi:hypothetical protein SDC9_184590 [bioreactor metagenome]|uniref:Uncharacterized protein n=1 Tax=bioreactor metagenome TaxID=1076179 RepID=A0A645HLV0_9ZZZZ
MLLLPLDHAGVFQRVLVLLIIHLYLVSAQPLQAALDAVAPAGDIPAFALKHFNLPGQGLDAFPGTLQIAL